MDERERRWRLILGEPAEEHLGALDPESCVMDRALEALYDAERKGSLGPSCPNVARWLGDIRAYFPSSVVHIMQRDALERLGLKAMLLEPESLEEVQPDVNLAATLISLSKVIPAESKSLAREVVRRLVREILARFETQLQHSVRGALQRAARHRRPRWSEIDWDRTIRLNLKHYQPAQRAIIPERVTGYQRRATGLHDLILCLDQSGSMAASIVYAGIFGSVLASIRSLRTTVLAFDTEVVDLSENLEDPVDVLFGVQLGGGTDIARCLAFAQTKVVRPGETTLILITDLYEGGCESSCLGHFATLKALGVNVIVLLALNDRGAPAHNARFAAQVAEMDIPVFACTPDWFPELVSRAIQRRPISALD